MFSGLNTPKLQTLGLTCKGRPFFMTYQTHFLRQYLLKGCPKGRHGQRVCGIWIKSEVRDELVFCGSLQIISGFGLPVSHRIFFHVHKGGVLVCLGIRVAVT